MTYIDLTLLKDEALSSPPLLLLIISGAMIAVSMILLLISKKTIEGVLVKTSHVKFKSVMLIILIVSSYSFFVLFEQGNRAKEAQVEYDRSLEVNLENLVKKNKDVPIELIYFEAKMKPEFFEKLNYSPFKSSENYTRDRIALYMLEEQKDNQEKLKEVQEFIEKR